MNPPCKRCLGEGTVFSGLCSLHDGTPVIDPCGAECWTEAAPLKGPSEIGRAVRNALTLAAAGRFRPEAAAALVRKAIKPLIP